MKIILYVCVNLLILSKIYAQQATLEFDINNSGSSSPTNFINTENGFVFIATNGTKQEIWQYKNGTYNLIHTATGSISKLSKLGSILFFEDYLYIYPWTHIESLNLLDLNTNQNHSYPNIRVEDKNYYTKNGYFIFYSWGVSGTRYLYKIDLQTFELSKINPSAIDLYDSYGNYGIYTETFVNYKDLTIMSAYNPSNSLNTELYKVSGTNGGIQLLKDINVGPNSSKPFYFKIANDLLFFLADDVVHGLELWVTNGENQGTLLLNDITSGNVGTNFKYLEVYDNLLYFIIEKAGIYELWSSNGTAIGTVKVLESNEVFNRFTFYSNYILLYTATGYCPLWKYDITTQTKVRVAAFYRFLEPVYTIDNLMFFRAENLDWVLRDHFFVYNIDTNQTYWLSTDNQNKFYYKPQSIFKDGAFLYFSAIDYFSNRREMFRTDGSTEGTKKYILNNLYASNPSNFIRYNDNIFFSGYYDDIIKQELCKIPLVFCKNNEIISNDIDISISKKANKSIQADSEILGNINVIFNAGKSVILNPGFSTNNGVVFKASIEGCSNN